MHRRVRELCGVAEAKGSLTLRASHQRPYDALVRNTSSSDSAEAVVVNGVRPTLIMYGSCGCGAVTVSKSTNNQRAHTSQEQHNGQMMDGLRACRKCANSVCMRMRARPPTFTHRYLSVVQGEGGGEGGKERHGFAGVADDARGEHGVDVAKVAGAAAVLLPLWLPEL
jgi:hypothetical protein